MRRRSLSRDSLDCGRFSHWWCLWVVTFVLGGKVGWQWDYWSLGGLENRILAGIPLLGGVFPGGNVSGRPLWLFWGGVNWGGGFGRMGGLEIQICAGIHLFGGVLCVRIGAGRLIWAWRI